mmetsp:Transcript_98000/g.176907  ORF Transcript_98000/g.176907 Transcript_98000/m.176907 type:complete len:106 (-) Transcript_98000:67-384(-)
MKYWSVPIDLKNVDYFCDRTQEDCSFELRFSKNAKVLQWSWFGEQDKHAFTPEGMAIVGVLSMLMILPVLISSNRVQRWVGVKKQQLRSITALNSAICSQGAMRS